MALVPWTQTLHQAAITGKVIDEVTSRPVAGVKVEITAMPVAFARWLSTRALQLGAAWQDLSERPDRTSSDADGGFRFLDLPDGVYTLSLSMPHAARRYGATTRSASVSRDPQGVIPLSIERVMLPPTGVRGRVQTMSEGQQIWLPMARIRVVGSGERGFTDEQGWFYMTDIEPGARTLETSAPGNDTLTTSATIIAGQVADVGLVMLVASP